MKIGDKATYFPESSDPLAAIDTDGLLALCVYVHLSGLVNLCVFSPHGRTEGRTNVPVVNGTDKAIGPGTCKPLLNVVAPPVSSMDAAGTIVLDEPNKPTEALFTLSLPETTNTLPNAPDANMMATAGNTIALTDAIPFAPPISNLNVADGCEQFATTVDGTGTAEQQSITDADVGAADFLKATEAPPILSDVVQTSSAQDAPINVDGEDTSSNPIQ